jgi:hypothetical protein
VALFIWPWLLSILWFLHDRANIILEKRQNKSAVTIGWRRRYMVDVGIGATIEAVQPKLWTVIPT